jgi:YgiT-type zinc finger domain-containing protein
MMLRCVVCKNGIARPGSTTVTLEREGHTLVLKSVPADVCDNCGETFLSQETTRAVLERAEVAVAQGVEVEVVRFVAA